MDEESFKRLRSELIKAEIIGSYQKRELVFQDKKRPILKIYIYKEPNHNRPHVHVYFGNEEQISICIKTREYLAGRMNAKFLKHINLWVTENEGQLIQVWNEIQLGKKPELLWPKNT